MPATRAILCLLALPLAAAAQTLPLTTLQSQIEAQLPQLTATYQQLHQHPELSHHEEHTSAFLADQLRQLGYQVTEHIGRYPDGSQAWGIAATLKNGPGPTVLIRTDMDALPVTEATGLPYASQVRSENADHQPVGVMHACGHDIHMSVFLGTARELSENKQAWHGAVVLVGQPSEEMVDGAKAMLADNFYQRFPKPDFILDEHDDNDHPSGHIALAPGPLLASSTSVQLTFHGIGGHGSAPALGKDPIVMASEFVMLAQTVVSRQISALDPAVLTIGTFHSGSKNNIIPDDAVLGLSLRAYSEPVRLKLLDGVTRTANGVATAYGVAPNRMPEVKILQTTTPTINDAALTERLRKVAIATLGPANVEIAKPVMGSEDVGYFSLDNTIPFLIFRLGAADPAKLAEAQQSGAPLPSLHSALFAPIYEPTIRTGVLTMTAMALNLLQN